MTDGDLAGGVSFPEGGGARRRTGRKSGKSRTRQEGATKISGKPKKRTDDRRKWKYDEETKKGADDGTGARNAMGSEEWRGRRYPPKQNNAKSKRRASERAKKDYDVTRRLRAESTQPWGGWYIPSVTISRQPG